jgi:hypothetical protein
MHSLSGLPGSGRPGKEFSLNLLTSRIPYANIQIADQLRLRVSYSRRGRRSVLQSTRNPGGSNETGLTRGSVIPDASVSQPMHVIRFVRHLVGASPREACDLLGLDADSRSAIVLPVAAVATRPRGPWWTRTRSVAPWHGSLGGALPGRNVTRPACQGCPSSTSVGHLRALQTPQTCLLTFANAEGEVEPGHDALLVTHDAMRRLARRPIRIEREPVVRRQRGLEHPGQSVTSGSSYRRGGSSSEHTSSYKPEMVFCVSRA